MRGNSYLSRPVGSNEPPRFRRKARIATGIPIGNRPAETRLHHAVVADRFIPIEELYTPKKR